MGIGTVPIAHYGLTPYCGAPPDPATLAARWNLDPLLISGLLIVLAAYGVLAGRQGWADTPMAAWRQTCFRAGWTFGSIAAISPLCPLSVSLFSARVGQHMWLTSVAAPLIALGLPQARGKCRGLRKPLLSAVAFAGALWLWHAPQPYLATFESGAVYWTMHATLFGSAVWLWWSLLSDPQRNLGAVMAGAGFTTLQMGLLGAAITFAGHPLYSPHALTTAAWGLSQLQDQELGGVIMWAPAGVIIVGAIVGGLALAMRRAAPAGLRVSRA